eukprot:scaffold5296_cov163-Amphora_coffeaeformis.AAC.6
MLLLFSTLVGFQKRKPSPTMGSCCLLLPYILDIGTAKILGIMDVTCGVQGRSWKIARRVYRTRPSLPALVGILILLLNNCQSLTLPFYSTQVLSRPQIDTLSTKQSLNLAPQKPTHEVERLSSDPTILSKGNGRVRPWEKNFAELVRFKDKWGHVNVPQLPNKEIPDDYKELATFCRNLRSHYKYLSDPSKAHLSYLDEDRIKRLESIGFVWNSHEAAWQRRFEQLVKFHDVNGHCEVPREKSRTLNDWITVQRRRYKLRRSGSNCNSSLRKLSQKEIRLLESIYFQWNPQRNRWWNKFNELKAYHIRHQNFNVPRHFEESPALPSYVQYLRRCCKEYVAAYSIMGSCEKIRVSGLDHERLEGLRRLEFCWLPNPDASFQDPPDDIFA